MPYLGDYLGHLLAEVAIARMHGDLETVRIAELYSSHPLLRTMAIPHFRMPDIDVELPMLMSGVEAAQPGAPVPATPKGLRTKFDEVLDAHLAESGVALSTDERAKLAAALDSRAPLHDVPSEVAVGVHRVADDLAEVASKTLDELHPAATGPAAAGNPRPSRLEALKQAARAAMLALPKTPPRLKVLVNSAEIRESASTDNVVKIRLKISEQGVEWASTDSESGRREQLVPE